MTASTPAHDTTDPDVCPGPCNRAWETAERHTHETGEPHNLHPNPGQPIWCEDCRERIHEHLLALPNLATQLPDHGRVSAPPDITGITGPGNIHASPSPVYDLRDELNRWLRHTEDTIRTNLGHTPNHRPPQAWRSARYVAGYITHVLAQDPDGIDFGMAVDRWYRRLERVTGTGILVHHLPGTCPTCERRGRLRRKNGEDLVKCAGCGTCWDYDHWQFLARAAAYEGRPA